MDRHGHARRQGRRRGPARHERRDTPGPSWPEPRAGADVAESATTYLVNDELRKMIAETPQGLQIKATEEEEDGARRPAFSEFDPPEPVAAPPRCAARAAAAAAC